MFANLLTLTHVASLIFFFLLTYLITTQVQASIYRLIK
ncbi:hypothetical protein E1A91_A04G114100v1 [Gossypium mustelinum]|uniref:Uncharacterized protein n=1 Tax=Gossypium mustelinum TaxID=34275 RepID=A0A5D2ZP34_GOSMU|nr:hypothetical protein E1A91_A04G114100v1 [Gossypium mustelinum]